LNASANWPDWFDRSRMPETKDITTPVAIVGGGPVGLVLAL
jgi:NADPH-dependent 2,4-dienoyl-CoA reductase/sulfur reductase-like enzyme